MNTPSLAQIELVEEFQACVQACALSRPDPEKIARMDRARNALYGTLAAPVPQQVATTAATPESFQSRVQPWMMACFGAAISADCTERNHRFLEEALELVQSTGCTASESHQLVDYVYGRPLGEPNQEVGGVMVTLAALCLANEIDMHEAGETELARIWTMTEKIRSRQDTKPKHSPLAESRGGQPAAASLPKNAGEIRQFIGSNYDAEMRANASDTPCGWYQAEPSENDMYKVSAHDLLSSFRQWADRSTPAEPTDANLRSLTGTPTRGATS